jgi:hypothetical protein
MIKKKEQILLLSHSFHNLNVVDIVVSIVCIEMVSWYAGDFVVKDNVCFINLCCIRGRRIANSLFLKHQER